MAYARVDIRTRWRATREGVNGQDGRPRVWEQIYGISLDQEDTFTVSIVLTLKYFLSVCHNRYCSASFGAGNDITKDENGRSSIRLSKIRRSNIHCSNIHHGVLALWSGGLVIMSTYNIYPAMSWQDTSSEQSKRRDIRLSRTQCLMT